MFIKYQTKKNIGNQSAYRDDANSSTVGLEIPVSTKDINIDDDQSDTSSVMLRLANTPKSKRLEDPRFKSGRSVRGSATSSRRKSKAKGGNNRVQVIDDMDSDAESIGRLSQNDVHGINEDI